MYLLLCMLLHEKHDSLYQPYKLVGPKVDLSAFILHGDLTESIFDKERQLLDRRTFQGLLGNL